MSEPGRRRRKGNAFVATLSFGTLLTASAAALDTAQLRKAHTELQAAVDAAAISATQELDGTLEGIERARLKAREIAALNVAAGGPVDVVASEVRVGWIGTRGTFVEWSGHDAKDVDTLAVRNRPHDVPTALGALAFGAEPYKMAVPSGARRPMDGASARTAPCFLPIAVPDCHVKGLEPGVNPRPFRFTFSPTPSDTIAWADPDASPSTSDVDRQIHDQCSHAPISVGEWLYVNEGQHNSALKEVESILNGTSSTPADAWNEVTYGTIPPRDGGVYTANTPSKSDVSSSRWGRTLEGVVPIVDAGPDCSAVDFTKRFPITRFAWGVIYDVRTRGDDKNLYLQVDVVTPHIIWGKADPTIQSNVLTRSTASLTEVEP